MCQCSNWTISCNVMVFLFNKQCEKQRQNRICLLCRCWMNNHEDIQLSIAIILKLVKCFCPIKCIDFEKRIAFHNSNHTSMNVLSSKRFLNGRKMFAKYNDALFVFAYLRQIISIQHNSMLLIHLIEFHVNHLTENGNWILFNCPLTVNLCFISCHVWVEYSIIGMVMLNWLWLFNRISINTAFAFQMEARNILLPISSIYKKHFSRFPLTLHVLYTFAWIYFSYQILQNHYGMRHDDILYNKFYVTK